MAAEREVNGGQRTADSGAVRFLLDGKIIAARGIEPTTTVLEYLRDTLGRTGTKEGCAEGDCGACTVVLGELRPDGTGIDYRAVNSCIRYLPTIDGCELVTVESLQSQDSSLHPVQQSLVDHHASQCGFCTPGFVMSLFALYLNNAAPQKAQVVDALAGNLCRCTGYRPIIDAGCAQSTYPESTHWSRSDSQSRQRIAALKAAGRDNSLSLPGFKAPRSLHELANALADEPQSLLLAGGTDIGLWTTKQLRELPPLIYIGAVPELKDITVTAEAIRIGAAVTLSDAWPAIVKHYPSLADVARRFASPPVCNSGTLCGNVANGSPIGDSMPALMVLGARIQLRSGPSFHDTACGRQESEDSGLLTNVSLPAAGLPADTVGRHFKTRDLSLEDFYLGYQRKDLHAGEFITEVSIPLLQGHYRLACYKVSKRFEQDISAVCGAFLVVLSEDRIVEARIAFGGVAPIPVHAPRTEAALTHQSWSSKTIEAAAAVLAQEFDPLTDMRSSADYRRTIAANLLRRFFAESTNTLIGVRDTSTGALQ